uniref:CRAL-TRIO domain-containing protein n=1 Tax=Heterorhabditis bacteriophora TaxID=37862 RepID=A0A1I7XLK9_HETBA
MSSEDLLDLDYDETPETIVTCQEWETSLDTSPRRFVSSGNDAHHKTSDDLARKRAERFGITPRKFVKILQSDIDGLYNELRVSDGDFNLRTVIVKGVDDMTRFAVEKYLLLFLGIRIFAEYQPYRVEMFGNTSSLVHFASRGDAAKMLIGMTKTLRRIRAKKTAEDGEVVDSEDEDEEGQIKNEGGDDVAVVVHTVMILCVKSIHLSITSYNGGGLSLWRTAKLSQLCAE